MKIAYFDCFSGASGDMILGALMDAGLSLEILKAELAKLKLTHYDLNVEKIAKKVSPEVKPLLLLKRTTTIIITGTCPTSAQLSKTAILKMASKKKVSGYSPVWPRLRLKSIRRP